MRKLLLILFFFSLSLSACNLLSSIAPDPAEQIVNVSNDDLEMNAAIQRAQETLPLFIEAYQTSSYADDHFTIKVKFPYGTGDAAEHMWITDLTVTEKGFTGILGNEPEYIHDLQMGDTVDVKLENVTDWMILRDGQMLGGFSVHLLRSRMSETEQKQFDEQMGFTIPAEPLLP